MDKQRVKQEFNAHVLPTVEKLYGKDKLQRRKAWNSFVEGLLHDELITKRQAKAWEIH